VIDIIDIILLPPPYALEPFAPPSPPAPPAPPPPAPPPPVILDVDTDTILAIQTLWVSATPSGGVDVDTDTILAIQALWG
jgi:hypothetical protein